MTAASLTAKTPVVGSVQALAAMACVGSSVAVSALLSDGPVLAAQAVRYLLASMVLLAVVRGRGLGVPTPRGRDWLWLIGVAAAGQVLFNVALVEGTLHADPAVLGVAVAAVPLLLAVLGPLLVRRRVQPMTVLGAGVVTVGAVAIHGLTEASTTGIAWSLAVLLCEAAFTLLAVPLLQTIGPLGTSLHSTWIAAVMFAAMSLGTESVTAVAQLTSAHLLAAGYLAAVVTALAFVLWYSAVHRLGADKAGLFTGVTPATAALSGMMLGAAAPAMGVWAGILLVAAGLVVGLNATAPRSE